MNGTLGELLNLFEDDEQFKAQRLTNISDEDDRKMKKTEDKQNEETACSTVSNVISTDRKPSRSLISIDFDCSKANDDSSGRKKKTDSRSSLLHSNGLSSSEDEWDRSDRAIHLSDTGRNIKQQLKRAKGDCLGSLCQKESTKRKGFTVQENRLSLQGKAQQVTRAVESSSKDALKVYDPFFGIRIRNPTLSSAAFESYCDGLKKIRLSQLKSFSKLCNKWISLAIIIEKTSCRKSANGNEYMVWNTSDLTDSPNTNVKILVFGDCIKKFWKLQLGSVIALVTPPFADGDDKQITMKLTKCAQVLEMGFCPDFGHCKAVKKDGGLCQNVVNLSQCERCIYHVQRAAQKFTANRGSFASILANPNRKLPLQESNSLPGSIITVSRRISKISTNDLSMNENRKDFKQQQAKSYLKRSENLKESEKMTLDALIAKEAAICGTRSISQPHGKILPKKRSNESLKEFLLKQDENESSAFSPVLGKGLNSESVLLISPRKTVNKLSALENAKRKAIATVMKRGGLEKADPNSINGKSKKRRLFFSPEHKGQLQMKKTEISGNANDNSEEIGEFSEKPLYTADEISALLEKKSNHESELRREDAIHERRYFQAMEQKERLENYLTNTMEIKNYSVITCIECNYTSHKQSDLCKQLNHTVKHCKANKRFFRCKHCHRRTVSYGLLPTAPCTVGHFDSNGLGSLVEINQCGYNDFQRVAMKDEKRIKLAQENLLLRGEERKYVNC
uniref:Protein MCM10 homolog n=1 Tax=Elaeophora elaphi TaxID=1147741 RepID=A0A0R3RPJ6_9BILA